MPLQDRLKSFVLRRGRLTSNQSRALSEHWDKYILDNEEKLSNNWNQNPSILDIGFGSGETTAYLAKTKPEMLILGAEVYLSGIGSLLTKANEESLNNIKILNSDIVPFLENKVSDNCFDLILMFYPDPWPKRKHHKRRLLQRDFIDLVNKKLKQNKFLKYKKNLGYKSLLKNKYKLIINCDYSNEITKKFFYRNIKKDYKSFAYTTIIEHKKVLNNYFK